jgi:hypothetical protein
MKGRAKCRQRKEKAKRCRGKEEGTGEKRTNKCSRMGVNEAQEIK